MLQENKRKIIVLLSLGALIAVAATAVLVHLGRSRSTLQSAKGSAVVTLCLIIALLDNILLLWGYVLLARARGYSGAIVAATVVCGSLMTCIAPFLSIAAAILPLAVIFTLPDKNRIRSRRRRSH